jgi:glutamate decarboxylase
VIEWLQMKKRQPSRECVLDDVFASTDLSARMPKFKFPNEEHSPRHVYQAVHDELMLDGNSRQNLATFCSTWIEPEVHQLMDECIDKNMIDKDEYPQTAEVETRCVHMLADLWHSPDAPNTLGCSTTGSSEAAMLGGMAMKWRWREKMRLKGKARTSPTWCAVRCRYAGTSLPDTGTWNCGRSPWRGIADHDAGGGDQTL